MSKEPIPVPEEDNFGSYLRDTRLTHRINLETVAAETKIRVEVLNAMEKEQHDRLPPPAYVRGMLRSFARVIQADPNEVVRRYNNSCGLSSATCEATLGGLKSGRRRRWPWLLLLLALVAAALAAVIMLKPPSQQQHRQSEAVDQQPAPKAPVAPPQTATEQSQSQSDAQAPASQTAATEKPPEPTVVEAEPTAQSKPSSMATPGSYLLNIAASEKTWLKVLVDDQEAMEYALNAGDRLDLEAKKGINLLIGNAGGVQLTLNNEPYPVPGKSGQVVNVVIP